MIRLPAQLTTHPTPPAPLSGSLLLFPPFPYPRPFPPLMLRSLFHKGQNLVPEPLIQVQEDVEKRVRSLEQHLGASARPLCFAASLGAGLLGLRAAEDGGAAAAARGAAAAGRAAPAPAQAARPRRSWQLPVVPPGSVWLRTCRPPRRCCTRRNPAAAPPPSPPRWRRGRPGERRRSSNPGDRARD